MNFLHLSDLHICADDNANNSAGFNNKDTINMFDYIKSSVAYREHILIITGDIIDNVAGVLNPTAEFQRAYDILMPFKGRLLICPGNHDYAAGGNIANPACPPLFDKLIQKLSVFGHSPTFAGEGSKPQFFPFPTIHGIVFTYGIDTCREKEPEINVTTIPSPFPFPIPIPTPKETPLSILAQGQIGPEQMKALNVIMQTLPPRIPGNPRIIYMHHHPIDKSFELLLTDSDAFCRTIGGKVDIVLYGHRHNFGMNRNRYDVKYWLASGASPKDRKAWEIKIGMGGATPYEVLLKKR